MQVTGLLGIYSFSQRSVVKFLSSSSNCGFSMFFINPCPMTNVPYLRWYTNQNTCKFAVGFLITSILKTRRRQF